MTTNGVNVVSLREYARSRKARGLGRPLSLKGIQDAIASGRLRAAVTHVPGRLDRLEPKIADPALADRELEATTPLNQDSRQEAAAVALQFDPAARVLPPGPAPAIAPGPVQAPAAVADERVAQLDKERAEYAKLRREIAEHESKKKEAEATLRTLEAAERGGQLVRAAEVEGQLDELCRTIRDRLQALPSIVGRQVAFSLSLDEAATIEACTAAAQNWLRDLSADLAARGRAAEEAEAA